MPAAAPTMTRYFFILACLALVFVAAALMVGFLSGDVQEALAELQDVRVEIRAQQDGRLAREAGDSSLAELYGRAETLTQSEQWVRVHRMVGVTASLVVVLVYSISITYFIGTSRWCREVAETYELEPDLIQASNRVKRRAFPWAMAGMLWAVGIVALGAAADPSTGRADTATWVTPHNLAALLGVAWLVWSFRTLHGYIGEQHAIIASILEKVRSVRLAKGLDS